jgi:diaminohydroxyphosphoribosylaminopyrimidine deaminase/5-amino-6-(5-phosphoribosylamino)uracil reductase
MRLALSLGARGLGQVAPNPAVGCVIVRDGLILGRGWTQPGGRPHAEAMALRQAGAAARGADVYVTLEPCAHHGKTPPCADALIAAGVGRVVSALTDPDPRVSGQGHARLRAAGIEVIEGIEAEAARRAQAGFLLRILQGRPLVTLKLALTLDARIATATGESRWITGSLARRAVHAARARHDAVMVGAGTARADDPDLGVRGLGPMAQPVRVVVDSRLGLNPASRLGRMAGSAPVWLVHGQDAPGARVDYWQGRGARCLGVPVDDMGRVQVRDALRALGGAGITRVYCEGGAGLAASLLRAGQVDRLEIFSAGHVFGADGTAALSGLGVTGIGAPGFRLVDTQPLGPDLRHLWERQDFAALFTQ